MSVASFRIHNIQFTTLHHLEFTKLKIIVIICINIKIQHLFNSSIKVDAVEPETVTGPHRRAASEHQQQEGYGSQFPVKTCVRRNTQRWWDQQSPAGQDMRCRRLPRPRGCSSATGCPSTESVLTTVATQRILPCKCMLFLELCTTKPVPSNVFLCKHELNNIPWCEQSIHKQWTSMYPKFPTANISKWHI